jgi:hypothetical protein
MKKKSIKPELKDDYDPARNFEIEAIVDAAQPMDMS